VNRIGNITGWTITREGRFFRLPLNPYLALYTARQTIEIL